LIGEDEIETIEGKWCEFERLNFPIYKTNEIVINFLEKDGKNDTVIYCSIHYNEDTEKWHSENTVNYPYPKFNTYLEMKENLISLENDILKNGNSTIDFS
jgi:hypothetical protein